jgi:hypothetical protein
LPVLWVDGAPQVLAHSEAIMKFKRGDKVEWWSQLSGPTKAIFVEYDVDFPKRYCILAIKISSMTHTFRWPLSQVANVGEGRTIMTQRRMKGV